MPHKSSEARAAYSKEYKRTHAEVIAAVNKRYAEKNREAINRRSRERYARERGKYAEQAKKYRDRILAEIRAQEHERNAQGRLVPTGESEKYLLCFSDPLLYREWIAREVDKDAEEQGFASFRRCPQNLFPISYRRWPLYRRLLDTVLGPRCRICGFAGRLELAHLAYMEDSVASNDRSGSANFRRAIEALEHPDRFVRLCSLCHDIFDHSRKNGGHEYLDRIAALMRRSEELEDASRTFQKQACVFS